MPTNHAAYLPEKQAPKLEVRKAPLPTPKENEILIKTTAVAINPVDWKVQTHGIFLEDFPTILGEDAVGTVESVGPGVSSFSKGDRVFGHSTALGSGRTDTAAFQEYSLLTVPLVAKVPDNIKDEEAVVLPLAVDTAAAGLFEDAGLGMALPPSTDGKGKAILIWGGSGSVGSCAVQLASAAGYEVFTTASKRNHDFVQSLGASKVFDYNDKTLVDDIVAAMKGKDVVGAYDSISHKETVETICQILDKAGAAKKLQTTLPGTEDMATHGVEVHGVFAVTVKDNKVGPAIWKFLPEALKNGSFKAKPDAISAGKGLEYIQKGMDINKEGVSAKKVIVTL